MASTCLLVYQSSLWMRLPQLQRRWQAPTARCASAVGRLCHRLAGCRRIYCRHIQYLQQATCQLHSDEWRCDSNRHICMYDTAHLPYLVGFPHQTGPCMLASSYSMVTITSNHMLYAFAQHHASQHANFVTMEVKQFLCRHAPTYHLRRLCMQVNGFYILPVIALL